MITGMHQHPTRACLHLEEEVEFSCHLKSEYALDYRTFIMFLCSAFFLVYSLVQALRV